MKRLALPCLIAALGAPASASAWCRMTTSQDVPANPSDCITAGTPLAWQQRCLSYSIDDRGSVDLTAAELQPVLGASFDAWMQVRCGGQSTGLVISETSSFSHCQDAEYHTKSGNVNTIAFVTDFAARMYPTNAYAITTVWHNTDTGEILDADMLLNDQQRPYRVCPTGGCPLVGGYRAVDVVNVITHEAGHFLGLAHSADTSSTMYYEAPRGEMTKRTLEADDVAGLCAAYPPGTLSSACDPTPRHGLALDCSGATSQKSGRCSASPGERPSPLAALLLAVAATVTGARRLGAPRRANGRTRA